MATSDAAPITAESSQGLVKNCFRPAVLGGSGPLTSQDLGHGIHKACGLEVHLVIGGSYRASLEVTGSDGWFVGVFV